MKEVPIQYIKIICAFMGPRKCPVCEQPHQKDSRLVILEDKDGKLIDAKLMCSWCWVLLFVDMLHVAPDLMVEFRGSNTHDLEMRRTLRETEKQAKEKP